MDPYSNSNAARKKPAAANPPKVEKIIEGVVVQRKQPLGRRFKNLFFGGDARTVKSIVLAEVIVPGVKDMIFNSGQEALNQAIYGDNAKAIARGKTPGLVQGLGKVVPYNLVSSQASKPQISQAARAQHNFREIVLESKVEAMGVLEQMGVLMEEFETVTVGSLYGLLGIEATYVDHNFGWTDLSESGVYRIKEGWVLDLPNPVKLD